MIPVQPADIPRHWEFVERGLKIVRRRIRAKWTPEHVMQAIYRNDAGLYVCDDGFMVLQRLGDEWTSEPFINVWVMWFKPGLGLEHRAGLVAWLDEMTAKSGCVTWKFDSPRRGWARVGWVGPEWEIEQIIWRRKHGKL